MDTNTPNIYRKFIWLGIIPKKHKKTISTN